MGLFVSTTTQNVNIPELGWTIVHPTTDFDVGSQFSPEDVRNAGSLTTAIISGNLVWRKTAGGTIEVPTNYDPDFLDIESERNGTGDANDRVATIGDLTIAVGAAAGNKGEIQFRGNNVGTFASSPSLNWDDNKTSLQVGLIAETSLADSLITGVKNTNSYIQEVIQNLNSGGNASSDIVVTANNGTDSSFYGDFGINSSGYFDNAMPLSLANDVYLYSQDTSMTIGTATRGKYLLVHTGGWALTDERLRIVDNVNAKDALVLLKTHLALLADTTANRPTSPINGIIRYNSTTNKFEGYENGTWKDIIGSGEANTGSNLGLGSQVFKQKVGVNFEYRTITAGTGIALSQTANEIQIINTVTGTSAVIAYYFLNSQAPFSTSSAIDVAIAGITNTPAAGTYHIQFNAVLLMSTNGRLATFSVYKGGVLVADSARVVKSHSNNDDMNISTFTVVTFNGSETMEIRVNTTAASITVNNRSVFMEKLV